MSLPARAATGLLIAALVLAGCTSNPPPPGTPPGTPPPSGPPPAPPTQPPSTPPTQPPAQPPTPPPPPPPSPGACTIGVSGLGAHSDGERFPLKVRPQCSFAWTSHYVTAYFGPTSTDAPSILDYVYGCSTDNDARANDAVAVECQSPQPGTYYLRGFAQIPSGGQTRDYWSDEYIVIVEAPSGGPGITGAVSVYVEDVRSHAVADQSYAIVLRVAWAVPQAGSSDHLGAHWSTASHPESNFAEAEYPNGCAHTSGDVPGSFVILCPFHDPGTVYLRGHARLRSGGVLTDYWSHEVPVVVRAAA